MKRSHLYASGVAGERPQTDADRPIAVFDSGLGGLTVVREIFRTLGGEDVVYLGDSARVPYGTKSPQTVRRFAVENLAFLLSHRPKLVVVACNTASAAALDVLRQACPVELVDVIGPGAAAACRQTDGPIGVIGTEGTIASGAYERAIAEIDPNREVAGRACPLLVPIVEEGRDQGDPIVLAVLSDYLRDVQRRRPGALILGCTHYPLLSEAIAKVMGPDVSLVSSAAAAAAEARRRLTLTGGISPRASGGRLRCFTTDSPERFRRLGEARFIGGTRSIDEVLAVGTDELEAAGRQLAESLSLELGPPRTRIES
ncbi:MAG: glutamate racemase [Phycisphaerae bacterium]